MAHRPRKRFGQNFLQNQMVIDSIIQAIHPAPTDAVVEIGPGRGALTKPLLQRLDSLTAIELDTDLLADLSLMPAAQGKLRLIAADALTVDFQSLGSALRLVGNLPYNISTPLLFHALNYCSSIEDMHFMLQKEVVDRLAAKPGCKAYGRLSVMVQYCCEVTALFTVPPEAFYPVPKVESAIVRLVPYREPPFPPVRWDDLGRVVTQSFSMRRKTLLNNLKTLCSADDLWHVGIDPMRRPEQISVTEYAQLVNYITK